MAVAVPCTSGGPFLADLQGEHASQTLAMPCRAVVHNTFITAVDAVASGPQLARSLSDGQLLRSRSGRQDLPALEAWQSEALARCRGMSGGLPPEGGPPASVHLGVGAAPASKGVARGTRGKQGEQVVRPSGASPANAAYGCLASPYPSRSHPNQATQGRPWPQPWASQEGMSPGSLPVQHLAGGEQQSWRAAAAGCQGDGDVVRRYQEETGAPAERLDMLHRQGKLLQVPRDASGRLTSVGSAQHAKDSCRPCSFWASQRCHNAFLCNFCHLPHVQRRSQKRGHRSKQLLPQMVEG